MSRTFFVFCEDDCKFESMTKEQILTAIEQAVSHGEIRDVDTGFITTVKEINKYRGLRFWVGTTAEFNAIPAENREKNVLYIKTDDTTVQDMQAAIDEISTAIHDIGKPIEITGGKLNDIVEDGSYFCKHSINLTDNPFRGITADIPIDMAFVMTISSIDSEEKVRVLQTSENYTTKIYTSKYRNGSWLGFSNAVQQQLSMLSYGDKIELIFTSNTEDDRIDEIDVSQLPCIEQIVANYTALEARVAALEERNVE